MSDDSIFSDKAWLAEGRRNRSHDPQKVSPQVIPAEAVEAAAKEIDAPSEPAAQEIARRALEAAAPYILSAAFKNAADQLEYGNPISGWLYDPSRRVHAQQRGGEMNITEFLEARIAEDEARANEATGARWVILSGVNASMVNIDPTNVRDEKWKYGRFGHVATTSHDAAYAEHIARHDPARVLAECAAKRAIIEQRKRIDRSAGMDDWYAGYSDANYDALYALADVYKDHHDYQEAWAVGG